MRPLWRGSSRSVMESRVSGYPSAVSAANPHRTEPPSRTEPPYRTERSRSSLDGPAVAVSPLAERWRPVCERATAVVPPAGHYAVIAPHPDDEVLTVGGLIVQLVLAGADVTVVAVTDGGSAYPERFAHDDLARVRRREQMEAVRHLGVPSDRMVSLGLRDGRVAEREDELAEAIGALCTTSTTVVAPWSHDFHADHEAVGRAASRAARTSGCSAWYSLFWAWHHARPAAIDAVNLIRVDLDAEVQAIKASALACHVSQLHHPTGTQAMLTSARLEPARWPCEYFVVDGPARGQR